MTVVASRRPSSTPRLLILAFGGALGLGLTSAVAALLIFSWHPDPAPSTVASEPRVVLPAHLVPAPGADPVPVVEGKFWLANLLPGEGQFLDGYRRTEAFTRQPLSSGGLIAFSWRDPHLGCTVVWRPAYRFQAPLRVSTGDPGWFRNPCHGETYTKAGLRVFGPQPRSLDTMEVIVRADGSVVVYPDRFTLGAPDNPLRAVPYAKP